MSIRRHALTALFAFFLLAARVHAAPGGTVSGDDSADGTQVCRLAPASREIRCVSSGVIYLRDPEFSREPEFTAREVLRGDLLVDVDARGRVGYAWIPSEQKLYVDLNGNRDLTDDASGVFLAKRVENDDRQVFAGIPLEVRFSGIEVSHPLVATLDRKKCTYRLEFPSAWQGRMVLGGKEFRLVCAENGDGTFDQRDHLRIQNVLGAPWDDWDWDYKPLPLGSELLIDDQAYRLTLSLDEGEAVVQLSEVQRELAELRLAWDGIARLVLAHVEPSAGPAVIVDRPGATVQVPPGDYDWTMLLVEGGEDAWGLWGDLREPLSVRRGQPAILSVGPPLRNVVSAVREEGELELCYDVAGVGNETYWYVALDVSAMPSFAVYCNDREIASGRFQYDWADGYNASVSVPLRASGELRVLAMANLDGLGPADSKPVLVPWKRLWSLARIGDDIVVLAWLPFLVCTVFASLRDHRYGLVLLPVGMIGAAIWVVGALFSEFLDSVLLTGAYDYLLPLFSLVAPTLGLLWLTSGIWAAWRSWAVGCCFGLIAASTGALGYVCGSLEHWSLRYGYAVFVVVFPLAVALARLCCGGRPGASRFLLWLGVWCVIGCAEAWPIAFHIHLSFEPPGIRAFIWGGSCLPESNPARVLGLPGGVSLLCVNVLQGLASGVAMFAALLPFLALAYGNSLYRPSFERFHRVTRPPTVLPPAGPRHY